MTNASRQYLKSLSVAERKAMAKEAAKYLTKGTLNPKTLWFIGEGKRDPGQELQVALEAASNGRVRPEDFIQELRSRKAS